MKNPTDRVPVLKDNRHYVSQIDYDPVGVAQTFRVDWLVSLEGQIKSLNI